MPFAVATAESPVGLMLTVRTTSVHRRELLLALSELRERALASPETGSCDFLEDVCESHRFIWMEWWPEHRSAETGVKSASFHSLLGAVRLLGNIESAYWVQPDQPAGKPLLPFLTDVSRAVF